MWQADLVEMIPYSKFNKGYKYILVVIDVFSKYAWTIPVENKTANSVSEAFNFVLKQGRVPNNLQTDHGLEFYNKDFQTLMKSNNINHYSTYSEKKACVVERLNRTLKQKMWKQFTINGNYKWLDMLPVLVNTYNNTKHQTIKMTPINASNKDNEYILKPLFQDFNICEAKYKIGDKVRISKYKSVFKKGYTPNWTTEIFTVCKIINSNPTTYHLKDYLNNELKGCFYEYEINSVKHDDVFLVEKIIKQRANKVFVKWLGFDSTHNSWIDVKDVV